MLARYEYARQPKFEYVGTVYHAMARGNSGDEVFVSQDDRKIPLQYYP
jgi:hypothetical protein